MTRTNRLGAPTEGLGQTVTFANGGAEGVPQLSPLQLSGVRGPSGGGGEARISGQAMAIPDASEGLRVLEVVQRFGDQAFAPKIEEQKQAAFINGMHRVAAGEAVRQVVEEQPWYSNLFGPTPVVEGARAFASFSIVQQESLKLEQDMPELRKLSPPEFQRVLTDRLTAVSANETGTDVLVQQAFLREMPRLLREHTKEHIGWQQAQYAEQVRNAQSVAASRYRLTRQRFNPNYGPQDILEADHSNGSFIDSNDLLEAQIDFVQTFRPVPGVPLETHQTLTTKVVTDLLSQNDLHAFSLLESAGVIDDLGPDNARRLRDYADRIESRVRANMPTELVERLAAIRAMPSLHDQEGINEQLKAAVNSLNADYQRITGAREPLLQGNTAADLYASLYRNQINHQRNLEEAGARARDQAATPAERQAAEQQAQTDAAWSLLTGATVRLTVDQREQGWNYLRNVPQEEGAVQSLFAARYNSFGIHTDEQGQASIRAQAAKLVNAGDPQALEVLYQTEYLPMVQAAGGKEHVAKAYFGDYSNVFSRYHSLRRGAGSDAGQIIAAGAIALADHTPLATAKDSVDQVGLKAVHDMFDSWIGQDKVAPHLREDMWRLVRNDVRNMIGDVDTNLATVVGRMQADGLEFAGGLFWQANKDNTMTDAVVRLAGNQVFSRPDDAPRAIGNALRVEAERHGLQSDSLRPIFNVRSKPGDPEILLLGVTDAGQARVVSIKASTVLDHWSRSNQRTAPRVGAERRGSLRSQSSAQPYVPNH